MVQAFGFGARAYPTGKRVPRFLRQAYAGTPIMMHFFRAEDAASLFFFVFFFFFFRLASPVLMLIQKHILP